MLGRWSVIPIVSSKWLVKPNNGAHTTRIILFLHCANSLIMSLASTASILWNNYVTLSWYCFSLPHTIGIIPLSLSSEVSTHDLHKRNHSFMFKKYSVAFILVAYYIQIIIDLVNRL